MTSQSVPTPSVSGAELAGNVAQVGHDLSLMNLFLEADIIVKAVILGLFLASVWSWKIIFDKSAQLQVAQRRARKFEDGFWESDDLEHWYTQVKRKANHPLARVFLAGMREWSVSKEAGPNKPDRDQRQSIRERVRQVMQVATNRELDRLEREVGFLATLGSTAPFVGLFGTVWGIMNSFQNIATEKSTNLVVVAPGIAEALFATAIGLLAAIPAVIFYNRLSGSISQVGNVLDDFTSEFDALLSRQFDSKE